MDSRSIVSQSETGRFMLANARAAAIRSSRVGPQYSRSQADRTSSPRLVCRSFAIFFSRRCSAGGNSTIVFLVSAIYTYIYYFLIPAAAICAISNNLGGFSDTAASASRNIVLQKGHAAPTTCAPVATSSFARV